MLSASLPPVAGTLLFIAIEALVVDTKAGDKPDWSVVTSILDIVLIELDLTFWSTPPPYL